MRRIPKQALPCGKNHVAQGLEMMVGRRNRPSKALKALIWGFIPVREGARRGGSGVKTAKRGPGRVQKPRFRGRRAITLPARTAVPRPAGDHLAGALARSIMARSSTSQPAATSSLVAFSTSLWLIPDVISERDRVEADVHRTHLCRRALVWSLRIAELEARRRAIPDEERLERQLAERTAAVGGQYSQPNYPPGRRLDRLTQPSFQPPGIDARERFVDCGLVLIHGHVHRVAGCVI
jgi:hypothetical protein